MEDPDEISGSEISRVESLERIVNRFKLAVSGDGNVLGGFGKLPKNQKELPLPERLANITRARIEFSLSGLNVDVAGSFHDGFRFS
jgi:hypothetical protein